MEGPEEEERGGWCVRKWISLPSQQCYPKRKPHSTVHQASSAEQGVRISVPWL